MVSCRWYLVLTPWMQKMAINLPSSMNYKWAWCMPHQCRSLRYVSMVWLGTPKSSWPQLWEWHAWVRGHSFSLGSGMRIHMLLGQAQTCPTELRWTQSPHETWAPMSVWATVKSKWSVTILKTNSTPGYTPSSLESTLWGSGICCVWFFF